MKKKTPEEIFYNAFYPNWHVLQMFMGFRQTVYYFTKKVKFLSHYILIIKLLYNIAYNYNV